MRSIKLPSWIERLAGLEPVAVPPHVFAVEPTALRYGRFVRAESGYEFEGYREVPLPPGTFGDGPLGRSSHEPAALLAALDQLMEGGEAVTAASLVLPDTWLRMAFVELDEAPRSAAKREEILRWKLRRTVPFRVEDLRLVGVPVAPLNGDETLFRWLLCFGVEALLAQLEDLFARRGIRVGQMVAASLATASAIQGVPSDGGLDGLVTVAGVGYGVTILRDGEPVLHRFRPLEEGLEGDATDRLVVRDLRLTRTFLRERLPGVEIGRVLLAASPEGMGAWSQRLEAGFERPVVALAREQLPLRGQLPEVSIHRVAPLLGAACQEAA